MSACTDLCGGYRVTGIPTATATPAPATPVPLRRQQRPAGAIAKSRSYWHPAVPWNAFARLASTLRKRDHLQLVGELRTRQYQKEYGLPAANIGPRIL